MKPLLAIAITIIVTILFLSAPTNANACPCTDQADLDIIREIQAAEGDTSNIPSPDCAALPLDRINCIEFVIANPPSTPIPPPAGQQPDDPIPPPTGQQPGDPNLPPAGWQPGDPIPPTPPGWQPGNPWPFDPDTLPPPDWWVPDGNNPWPNPDGSRPNEQPPSTCTGIAECARQYALGNPPDEAIDDVDSVVSNIVNSLLFIVGFLSVIMIIVGGIKYSTSAGDPAKVSSARLTIMYAIGGLVVSILAFAIVYFVVGRVSGSTTEPTTPPDNILTITPPPPPNY